MSCTTAYLDRNQVICKFKKSHAARFETQQGALWTRVQTTLCYYYASFPGIQTLVLAKAKGKGMQGEQGGV